MTIMKTFCKSETSAGALEHNSEEGLLVDAFLKDDGSPFPGPSSLPPNVDICCLSRCDSDRKPSFIPPILSNKIEKSYKQSDEKLLELDSTSHRLRSAFSVPDTVPGGEDIWVT